MTPTHGLGLLVLGSAAMAQAAGAQSESAGDAVVRDFAACRRIAEPDARLACFDRTAAKIETAIQSRELTVVDRADVRKAKRSLFGFTLPRIGLFSSNGDDDVDGRAFTEINTTIASVSAAANGRAIIHLADDGAAVWQTTDPVNFLPKPGTRIRIRKGAIGTYFLAFDRGSYRGVRVR